LTRKAFSYKVGGKPLQFAGLLVCKMERFAFVRIIETQSGRPDSSERPDKTTWKAMGRGAERENMLLSVLTTLGFSKDEARERTSEVLERVGNRAESIPEGDLIKEAFRRRSSSGESP
jgi:hypothetical protein